MSLKIILIGVFSLFTTVAVVENNKSKANYFKRTVKDINQKVFYGLKESNENASLLHYIINDVNKIFSLPDIAKVKNKYEMRIYHINSFGSIFFRQQYVGSDTTIADLYTCNGIKINDSLFVNIRKQISIEGSRPYSGDFNGDGVSDIAEQSVNQKEGVLDDICQYMLQVKRSDTVQSFLIDKPFTIKPQTAESRYVSEILRNLQRDFGIHFNSSEKNILGNAMLRPYGRNIISLSEQQISAVVKQPN
jgi:hypothetical protein